MESDNKKAQKARAESLRKQIAELTTREEVIDTESPETGSDAQGSRPKVSSRDFVERRMRELDKVRGR